MVNIDIISPENGKLIQSLNTNVVKLTQNSIVKINLNTEEVATITRQGNAAVITLKNGEKITLENYFDFPAESNKIIFENDGELYWAQFTDAFGAILDTINYIPLEQLAIEESVAGLAISPWLIGAGLAAGLGGAIAAVQGDSNSDSDTEPPEPPSDVVLNAEGTEVTGKGEPGAEVIVKDKDGNEIGSGKVDENGDFRIDIVPPLTDGNTADVILKDESGNESAPVEITGEKDTLKPDAPTDLELNEEGTEVTGKGEPGTEVIVKDKDGNEIGSGKVDENGDLTIDIVPPLTDGNTADVILKDESGNESAPV